MEQMGTWGETPGEKRGLYQSVTDLRTLVSAFAADQIDSTSRSGIAKELRNANLVEQFLVDTFVGREYKQRSSSDGGFLFCATPHRCWPSQFEIQRFFGTQEIVMRLLRAGYGCLHCCSAEALRSLGQWMDPRFQDCGGRRWLQTALISPLAAQPGSLPSNRWSSRMCLNHRARP